jgi:FtsP/CotA-like multicopper oxidase with cupredoxin domain
MTPGDVIRRPSVRTAALLSVAGLALAACTSGSSSASSARTASSPSGASSGDGRYGVIYDKTGTGPMVEPTIPSTPSGNNSFGRIVCVSGSAPEATKPLPDNCTRVFELTAEPVVQQIARFPMKTATVWGYAAPGLTASSPGPTLISYEGEKVQIKETNRLPDPTTTHVHGLHQPNDADGVAGVSQVDPIAPGATYAYPAFMPGHVGTFSYHSHYEGAVQDMRGLDGMWDVLPRQEHQSVKPDVDLNMTLQIWGWMKEGSLVQPFGTGPDGGKFPFDTINGKTGDASGSAIEIQKGQRVRIRVYNASQQVHSMHLHGHDELAVSKNGHAIPVTRETTQNVSPGDFYEIEFTADNPGNWIFHCHFPHHTANGMAAGFNGSPVGMNRIFHYKGFQDVDPRYFTGKPTKSSTL